MRVRVSGMRQFCRKALSYFQVRSTWYSVMPCRQAVSVLAWGLNITKIIHTLAGLAIKEITVLVGGQGKVFYKCVPTKHPHFKSPFTMSQRARSVPKTSPLFSLPSDREAQLKS